MMHSKWALNFELGALKLRVKFYKEWANKLWINYLIYNIDNKEIMNHLHNIIKIDKRRIKELKRALKEVETNGKENNDNIA